MARKTLASVRVGASGNYGRLTELRNGTFVRHELSHTSFRCASLVGGACVDVLVSEWPWRGSREVESGRVARMNMLDKRDA